MRPLGLILSEEWNDLDEKVGMVNKILSTPLE
jgi:hypothetical protein